MRQETAGVESAPDPVDERPTRVEADPPDRRVSVAEVGAIAAASVVGIVALVSLVAAHLHHHTPAVVGIGSLLAVAAVAAVVLLLNRPTLRLDLFGLVPVLVGIGIAAVMLFPGFHYGTGDRDPGAYVEIASQIQHGHSIQFSDDLLSSNLPAAARPSSVLGTFPALWTAPHTHDQIFPQFYHLWPALLATAKDAGGWTGLFNTGPLCGLIAVALAVAVARRIGGLPAAWTVAILLPTNMLEVWQSKYPSAEIFGQMLFLGGLAGVVIAIKTGWRSAAALAGLLIGLSYLERPDGIVIVLMAWAGLAALLAVRRFDARAMWFAAGLIVTLPYAFYQAYHLARAYTLVNNVPTLSKVLLAMIGLGVVAAALASQRRVSEAVLRVGANQRSRLILGWVFFAGCAVLMLVGGLRRKIFGIDYTTNATGKRIRTFDEISLVRLSWFFSLPGLGVMLLGIGFVALSKWRFDRWVVTLPAVGLLALYCYHVRNSSYMMWSTRRFVTTVVPGMVLLMGCGMALVVAVARRYLPAQYRPARVAQVVVAAALAGLLVFNVSESWPLRSHDENGGSVEIEQEIAALAGPQKGVFVWQNSRYCCNAPYQLFGGPLMTMAHQSSARLPVEQDKINAMIKAYLTYFPERGRPVFYIQDAAQPRPLDVPGVTTTQVRELAGSLPHWEETFISRPKKRKDYPYHLVIFRLTPAG